MFNILRLIFFATGAFNFTNIARKVSKYGFFSGPHFPVFGQNMQIYGVNLRIQSEQRKIRTRKNSVSGHFSHSEILPQSNLKINILGKLIYETNQYIKQKIERMIWTNKYST